MSQYGLACEQEKLIKQLQAAKLREAEWKDRASTAAALGKQLETLKQERDAALSALEKIVSTYHGEEMLISQIAFDMAALAKYALAKQVLANPTASLAERDRAIEKRTAEKCLEMAGEEKHPFRWNIQRAIIREFGLSDDRRTPNTD